MILSIEDLTRIAYEANRQLNIVCGNHNYPTWDAMSPEDREMFCIGVRTQLANPNRTAKELHDYWTDDRIKNGWTYGPVRDYEKKTHPSMVPFEEMNTVEQVKDDLFIKMMAALSPLHFDPISADDVKAGLEWMTDKDVKGG